MIWRRLCEIFSSNGAERKVFKMLSMLLMPRPRPPSPAEIMMLPMMLKLPDPHIAIEERFFVSKFVYLPRNHDLELVNQNEKIKNGHGPLSDDDEDIEALKSSSLVLMVMPCTSSTDAVPLDRVPRWRNQTCTDPVQDFSDEASCTDNSAHGDAKDDDISDDQQQDLMVTFRSNNNEEFATARLIKRFDTVDEFLQFAGALLRSIQNEQLKLTVIEDISQILLNAKIDVFSLCIPRLL